jgi:hypothetical protein
MCSWRHDAEFLRSTLVIQGILVGEDRKKTQGTKFVAWISHPNKIHYPFTYHLRELGPAKERELYSSKIL